MGLRTQPLGRTGLQITGVGLGSWAIGGGGWSFGWGPQDDADSVATMRHALELGVNWIDTAAVYGLGHSEEVVGRLLREVPAAERPLVFTKCGLIWDERDPMAPPRRVLKPDSIRRECEASLRRLGIERIDLYQFHWPDDTATPVEESWADEPPNDATFEPAPLRQHFPFDRSGDKDGDGWIQWHHVMWQFGHGQFKHEP
jgi:aryl-alcohol dehydrogenase-like predicted oxidoreductase